MEARTQNWILYKVPTQDRQFFKKVMTHWGNRIIIDTRLEPDWQIKYLHVTWVPFEIDEETRKKAEYQREEVSKDIENKQLEEEKKKVEKRANLVKENKKNLAKNAKKTKKR